MLPATLLREFRGRWEAGKDTWNTFAGIPCQVDGGKSYLERFRGDSVAGGKQEGTPGTLLQEFRARWEAGKDTWNAFAGKPCQVDGREMPPGTLSLENRGRWKAEKRHLEHFRWKTVAGGRRRRGTWNAFAGIPCHVDGGEEAPGTLSLEYRAMWTAEKRHLEHFCRNSVPGGR